MGPRSVGEELQGAVVQLAAAERSVDAALEEARRAVARLQAQADALGQQRDQLQAEREAFEAERRRVAEQDARSSDIIRLEVGGKQMASTRHTLTSIKGSLLATWFGGAHALARDSQGRVVLDRNPKWFRYLLDYLRDGLLPAHLPPDPDAVARIQSEFEHFAVPWPLANAALVDRLPATTNPVVLAGHTDVVVCVEALGPLAVSGGMDRTLRLWDLQTAACVRKWAAPDDVLCLALTPTHVACGFRDTSVLVYDVATGQPAGRVEHEDIVTAVAMSGRLLAACSCTVGQGSDTATRGRLRVWALGTLQPLCHIDEANALLKLGLTDTLLAGALGSEVKVWEAATGHIRHVLTGHGSRVDSVAIAGQLVVSCAVKGGPSGEAEFLAWDIDTGDLRHRLRRAGAVTRSLWFAYGEGAVVYGDRSHSVCVASLADGSAQQLKGHTDTVTDVAVSQWGVVSASKDRTVRLWRPMAVGSKPTPDTPDAPPPPLM